MVVIKHLPNRLLHPAARYAALASIVAQATDRFWPLYDALFDHSGRLRLSTVEQHARRIAPDAFGADFEADITAPPIVSVLDAHRREAERAGVEGTPAVFLNGRRMTDLSDLFRRLRPFENHSYDSTPKEASSHDR